MLRTDNDKWDLTTGVGITVTFGAVARAVATNKGLIDDPFAESLVRAVGVEYFTRLVEDQLYAEDGGDDARMPGLMGILVAHTRFLDQFLADAGRAGILRQSWPAALQRVGFDSAQRTVWIAEQLLVVCLPPDVQTRLLHDITTVSAPGSRCAADYLPLGTLLQPEEGHALVDRWRENGLDVDSAMLTHPREYRYVPEYLASHGWQTAEKNVVEMRAATGMPASPTRPRDVEITPRYVTAVRV